MPIVFLKVNLNAYDGPHTTLDERIKATAKLTNSYLQKTKAEIKALQTKAPIVHVLYYHSKESGNNLAHFEEPSKPAKWEYKYVGSSCRYLYVGFYCVYCVFAYCDLLLMANIQLERGLYASVRVHNFTKAKLSPS